MLTSSEAPISPILNKDFFTNPQTLSVTGAVLPKVWTLIYVFQGSHKRKKPAQTGKSLLGKPLKEFGFRDGLQRARSIATFIYVNNSSTPKKMMINRCWRGKQHTQKCLREYTIHAGVSYSWSFIEIGNSYDPRYWDFFYSSEFTMPDTHNTTEFADPTPGKQGSARMAQEYVYGWSLWRIF